MIWTHIVACFWLLETFLLKTKHLVAIAVAPELRIGGIEIRGANACRNVAEGLEDHLKREFNLREKPIYSSLGVVQDKHKE